LQGLTIGGKGNNFIGKFFTATGGISSLFDFDEFACCLFDFVIVEEGNFAAMILLMFRHGLRTAELVALKWSQVDLSGGYIEIHRAKHGHDSIHPLRSPELRALRQIQRNYLDTQYVFVSERKAPLSTRSIRHIVARAGERAGIPFQVHPHQLRHACGYYLAASGHDTRAIQDYLGHKNIHHTVRFQGATSALEGFLYKRYRPQPPLIKCPFIANRND
jgi:integrase